MTDALDSQWPCSWLHLHRDEFPQMAAVTRDYLAIPASKVAVERPFSIGRDFLGDHRQLMNGDTN